VTAEDPSLYPRALAVMLDVWNRTQKELEAVAGLPEGAVSNYLRGRVRLEREDLENLAEPMGLVPGFVDRTLDFLRSAPAYATTEPKGSFGEMREKLAARAGHAAEGFVRDLLDDLLREAGAWGERERGAALWERLRGHPHAGRLALVEEDGDFRGWALCERLCDESVRAAPRDAKEALELAGLALAVAEREPGPPERRARLEARAGAFLGNALRVSGDLPAADEAFARAARRRLEAGEMLAGAPGALPLDPSRELDLEASLRRDQRHFDKALALLDDAARLAQDDESRARIELKRAKTLEEDDRHAEAADLLRRAWPLVESTRDDRLRLVLRQNLLENLSQAGGRPEEAAELLPQARWMALELGNPLDLVRLRWVEGRLLALEGRTEEAIPVLDEVRRAFVEEGIAFDAALATLELAVEMLGRGRTAEVKRMAREMASIFKAQRVDRERFGAWLLFAEAAEREALTEEAARRLLAELRAARPRRNGI
jgi:tetratricopeptide (TPR) repeat protein